MAGVGDIFTNAMPWVQAGLGLLSTVKAMQGANAVEQQGEFNAKQLREEADAIWKSYNDRASILMDNQRRLNASAVAGYAKAGVTLQGTPMEVLNDMVHRQHLDQIALHDIADVDVKKAMRGAHLAEWQSYQEADSIRVQALSNFGSSLLTSKVVYNMPWTKATSDAVAAQIVDPEKHPNYSTAQANAVPGAGGWRPMN